MNIQRPCLHRVPIQRLTSIRNSTKILPQTLKGLTYSARKKCFGLQWQIVMKLVLRRHQGKSVWMLQCMDVLCLLFPSCVHHLFLNVLFQAKLRGRNLYYSSDDLRIDCYSRTFTNRRRQVLHSWNHNWWLNFCRQKIMSWLGVR